SVWVVAMDALAIGSLVMVIGSCYMWYRLKSKRTLGWIALTAGFLSCGLFVFGLASRGSQLSAGLFPNWPLAIGIGASRASALFRFQSRIVRPSAELCGRP